MSSGAVEGKSFGHLPIQIISGPDRIRQNYLNLVRGSQDEILLLIPTINALRREHSIGIFEELQNAVRRGVKIRLLSAEDDFIREMLDRLRASGIVVRRVETPTEAKFKMLIIDRRSVFIVETKDDSKSQFREAIGNAIYTTSLDSVRPYVTIFESFWRETDLYERAREADKVKDEFVHIAAHELRNPVMPILSGAELLSDILAENKEKMDAKLFSELESISLVLGRNATKLYRLSEDILQVSRVESRNFNLNFQFENLDDIIESSVDDVKKRFDGDRPQVNIGINRRYPAGSVTVYCDADKISQALMNLLDNALKFTLKGHVTVNAAVTDSQVLVSVSDSGSGIDPDVRSRLFEKFVTKSTNGTGLGLYLCKMIVEAHGGRIWFEDNVPGSGATFSFTIPLDDRSLIPPPAETAGNIRP